LVSRLFIAARLQPNIRFRCSQLLSTLATVARGEAITIVAEGSLPDEANPQYIKKPLSPAVQRQVGLAVLDQRQASPATRAFIELATRIQRP
jgi:DNA-binding transcriptional LysR family regulator